MHIGDVYVYEESCPNCHTHNYYMHIDTIEMDVVNYHTLCHSCNYLNINNVGLMRTLSGWITRGKIQPTKKTKCVCGGTKCNTTHSRWCDAYVK